MGYDKYSDFLVRTQIYNFSGHRQVLLDVFIYIVALNDVYISLVEAFLYFVYFRNKYLLSR